MTSGAVACGKSSRRRRSTRTRWAPSSRCDAQPSPWQAQAREVARQVHIRRCGGLWATLRGHCVPSGPGALLYPVALCFFISVSAFLCHPVSCVCLFPSRSLLTSSSVCLSFPVCAPLSLSVSVPVPSSLSACLCYVSLTFYSLPLGHCFFNSFIEVDPVYCTVHSFNGYNSVAFGLLPRLCNHHHYLILEHFHHPSQRKPIPFSHHTLSPSFPSPWQLLI